MENFPSLEKKIIEKAISEDGLQYPNIRRIDVTMKISWFKRIYTTNEGWASFPHMLKMDLTNDYGDVYQENLSKEVRTRFGRILSDPYYHQHNNVYTMNLILY